MSDVHAENKRLYAIDVAAFGEKRANTFWQMWTRLQSWKRVVPGWFQLLDYRRDPDAPPQPSLDWLDAPKWALYLLRDAETKQWLKSEPLNACGEIEQLPTAEWFAFMDRERKANADKPDADGWVPWHGNESGECPLPDGTRFKIKLRNGFEDDEIFTSPTCFWKHCGDKGDIIAYRVVKLAPTPDDDSMLSGGALHRAFAEEIDAGGDWWSRFEVRSIDHDNGWATPDSERMMWVWLGNSRCIVRRKPKQPAMRQATTTEGEVVEWPAPMAEAPAIQSRFFVAFQSCEVYRGDSVDQEWLAQGRCFVTREDAKQAEAAWFKLNGMDDNT